MQTLYLIWYERVYVAIRVGVQTIFQVDADDLEAANTTLRGIKNRYQETGNPPAFIHTVRLFLRNSFFVQHPLKIPTSLVRGS